MSTSAITVSRTVAAPPETVFQSWTRSERLATWWWPHLEGTTYEVDARPGGHYLIHSPAIDVLVHGDYVVVDPPSRLVFEWGWREGCIAQLPEDVEVSFERVDEGTTVTVVHTCRQADGESDLEQGWNDVLDRLVRVHGGQSTRSRS